MSEKDYTGLIPEQTTGKEITADASVKVDDTEAHAAFEKAKDKLLQVNDWQKMTGALGAGFQLFDADAQQVNREVRKGDFLRIDIPGPGSTAGNGFDWAKVEDLKTYNTEDVQSIAFIVRPTGNPHTNSDVVAHFYAPESTSTFTVTREKNKITAAIYDRNIEANEQASEPSDKLRNQAVGKSAKHAFSKLQWQALVNEWLK
jgi:hypothetical protein